MIQGGCACSAVRYEVDGAFREAHHCHCSVCRRTHGAAFATYACASRKRFRLVSGDAALTSYRSSPEVRRSFCSKCGASLFFEHDASPTLIFVAAGSIDEASSDAVQPDAHTFARSKATWWTIADDLPRHDGQRPEYGG